MKTMTAALTLRTFLWFGVSMGAFSAEVRMRNVDELIEFKDNVNDGTSYSGTTVFLDFDIDLTGKSFEPIGTDWNYFLGTFDGQGHVISNLNMSSSSKYVGLFGYSGGLTIKNVILDSSCSITSSFSGSNSTYTGGIIGHCDAKIGPCIIENSVNMGSVTFSGNVSDYRSLYLGGIAGMLYSSNYVSTVKNCANHGVLIHSGTSYRSCVGGIVGYFYGYSSSIRAHISNCLNHGTITHSGTTSWCLYLGGITGLTYYATIENCVSGGKISSTKSGYIGSIVGYVSSSTSINYCYFTSDLSGYSKYGGGTPSSESNTLEYDSTTFKLSGTVSIGNYRNNSLIGALNAAADNYTFRDYSHWLLNKNNNTVAFTINKRTNPVKMDYQIILLPSLAREGKLNFDGWYTDSELSKQLPSFEIKSETELYGKYCGPNFTVTLDVNGGDELTVKKMFISCDRVYGDLPTPIKTGHTFLGWFTEKDSGGELVTSNMTVKITQDHTLYAHWNINNYTLMFIFDNGTEPEVRILEFNTSITYPADPVKEGYLFAGWSSKAERMPANNTNITAQWAANNYTVTFNVSGGNISRSTKTVTFDTPYGELPVTDKTGFTFSGWFNEKNESVTNESIVKTPNNHTLHAHWLEISPDPAPSSSSSSFSYSLFSSSFSFSSSSSSFSFSSSSSSSSSFASSSTSSSSSSSLSFASSSSSSFSSSSSSSPSPTNQVEIIFSTKNLTQEEIEEIIKQFIPTDVGFTIALIERTEDEEIRVIVKFVDTEKAKSFVEKVKASNDGKTTITKVGYIQEGPASFSAIFQPMRLFLI